MSRSATPKGTVVLHACYIRRPGPESAPASSTSADWNSLLERCLRNRKADMLDAIRGILQGNLRAADVPPGTLCCSAAGRFCRGCPEQVEYVGGSAPGLRPLHGSLFGRYEIDFRFEAAASGLSALLEAMTLRFWDPVHGLAPRSGSQNDLKLRRSPSTGAVQCWLGLPETARLPGDAAHCDFWRVTPGAKAYLARGLQEDGLDGRTPGTLFDVTLPIWRTGEVLLYAGRLASALGATGELGLQGQVVGSSGKVADLCHGLEPQHRRQSPCRTGCRGSLGFHTVGEHRG